MADLLVAFALLLQGAATAPTVPPDEVLVRLLQKSPQFSGATGRTDLRVTRKEAIPGALAPAYFFEVAWKEGDRSRTAIGAVLSTSAPKEMNPRWIVSDRDWGLTTFAEDATFQDIVDSLRNARVRGNESATLGDVQTIMAAQKTYATVNDGLYGDLPCLNRPTECVPEYPPNAPTFLDPQLASLTDKSGYRRRFHAGPGRAARPGSATSPAGGPSPRPRGATSFAYTAVPIEPGESGKRGFCADSTGKICVTDDGTEPRVVNGACAPPCKAPAKDEVR